MKVASKAVPMKTPEFLSSVLGSVAGRNSISRIKCNYWMHKDTPVYRHSEVDKKVTEKVAKSSYFGNNHSSGEVQVAVTARIRSRWKKV